MRTIELTKEQRNKLIDALEDAHNGGDFNIEVEVSEDVTIEAVGGVDTDGYCEDDYHCGYMNGTGAWVETYRSAWVELTATVYTDDDSETCNVDAITEKEVEDYLNAA